MNQISHLPSAVTLGGAYELTEGSSAQLTRSVAVGGRLAEAAA